jgi:hypothetical protein
MRVSDAAQPSIAVANHRIASHAGAMGALDRPNDARRRINYIGNMNRDAILTELLELEGMLQDDRLNDHDRLALHGAQQALRNIIEPETWHPASQTFYRIDNKPSEAGSLLLH